MDSKMKWKRSYAEVEDELRRLHAAGEIDLDAWRGPATDLDDGSSRRAVHEAIWRIQGFQGEGRERTCAMCGQRFWGPWIAYVLCSDECMKERNRQSIEIMRRYRDSG